MSSSEASERAEVANLMDNYFSLFSQQRWDEWIDLWADDGILEFPYAPPGRRSCYVGKTEILAYMKPLAGRIKVEEVKYRNVHPMFDPKTACMELAFKAHVASSGAPLNQKYVFFLETKAGRIWRWREYWNPIISMDANGGREAWTAAFGSPERDGAVS